MNNLQLALAMGALLALFSFPALAAPACYSPAEAEAEQLLRLHSELMVITVTCKTGSQGQDLVRAYTGFTRARITELHDAEQTMARYYRAHGGGNGVAQLDTLRTKLGNEFGQRIADESAPVWCGAYRDKVLLFRAASAGQVREEVRRMMEADKTYVRACSQDGTRVAGKGG